MFYFSIEIWYDSWNRYQKIIMNIKIYTLASLFLSVFCFPFSVDAKWYQCGMSGCAPAVGLGSPVSNCSADIFPDASAPTIIDASGPAGDTGFLYVNWQTQVLAGWQCQWWDSTPPTASSLTYANPATNGWQNSTNITLNWTASDLGWSGLKNYDIRIYRSTSQWTPVALVGTLIAATTTNSYVYTWVNWQAYKFEVCPRDQAGNECFGWTSSSDIARIDTIPPVPASLINGTNTNLLATTSESFSFSYNDGGAPVALRTQIEDYLNSVAWVTIFNPSAFLYAHSSSQNISIVDWSDRIADAGSARQYKYRTTQICDQAGNCWNGTKDFDYNVYSNPNYLPSNTHDISALVSAVADGQWYNAIQIISDGYGNAIIPASGISRTISMNLSSISNSMFLNQYTRTWPTSIYITAPNNPTDQALSFTTSQIFASFMTSATGEYPLTIKAYTPTANSYPLPTDPVSDPAATFGLTTNLVVNDILIGLSANKTFSQTLLAPKFKPLYSTAIIGDLKNGGFIEGTEQISNIVVTNNNMWVSPISTELQLEFSGADMWSFDFYGSNVSNNAIPIAIRSTMVPNPGSGSTSLYTKLIQKSNPVSTGSNLQFSTHFAYTLNSKNVIYNSDIIGKTGGYWSNTLVVLWNQVWIKIIGPIASNVIGSIITGQFADGTSIFGGLSRAEVHNNMRKSMSLATRNMTLATVWDIISNAANLPSSGSPATGAKIDKGGNVSIMKIEKAGWFVRLQLGTGISGKRTIVVKGANLYITSNMYYSASDALLGVMVQKDENGNGWNLYIDPTVTNIVGTYIVDGSVMSSTNGVTSMGTSNIALLKNQLYIYGSILSENTIGGSRMSPVKCPGLVSTSCVTTEEAQKYDLNYLRRYYLYNGEPFGWALTKVIGNGTCSLWVCSWFDANLIKKFTTLSEDLAKYPVIVEYNPLIRSSPPIGFEGSKE